MLFLSHKSCRGKNRSWDVKVFADNIVRGFAFDSWHAEPKLESVLIGYYGNAIHAPQMQMVLLDADGEVFVHDLNYLMESADDVPLINADSLSQHKERGICDLEVHRGSPRVRAKYQWVANYHNYFCDQSRQCVGYHDDLAIHPEIRQIKPTTFVPMAVDAGRGNS